MNSDPDMTPALPYLTHLAEQVQASDNIWAALEVLTNALGAKAGCHLETLLCKETTREHR